MIFRSVVWQSEDTDIATVQAMSNSEWTARLTAKKAGTVIIKAGIIYNNKKTGGASAMTLEVEVDVFPSVSSYVPVVSSSVPGRSVTPTTNAGSSDSPASSMPDLVTTKITSLKQKGNKAVVKWKRKSKVSGYQIQYSKTKKFKKKKTITVKKHRQPKVYPA